MYFKLVIASIILLLIGFLLVHFLAPRLVIKTVQYTNTIPKNYELDFDEFYVKGHLGDSIHVAWINHVKEVKGTIIFLHGINSNKTIYWEQARWLADLNIASMLVDLRAHGNSGGDYCTFGFHEKHDISNIVDHIISQNPTHKVGIWGHSLGGAIAVQTMAIDDRISFGVIQSTFTDYNHVVLDYGKRLSNGLAPNFMIKYVQKRAGEIAQFDIQKIKPIESVKQISKPMFFAHGTDDANIRFDYGKALFDQCASEQKSFYPIQGGDHDNVYELGGMAYVQAIKDFISQNLTD